VDITFDNDDNRFPIDRPEITLKRTIGLKKDEFFLDNKHMSKTDVVNLLESAGLSRSNPYYIVEQGKVRTLINMTDADRLSLLKEIAGTRTYDERRKESLKIMKQTDARADQIKEVISFIKSRLAELASETKELKQYQELDSKRRSMEYTMYDKQMKKAIEALASLDDNREQTVEQTNSMHVAASKARKARQDAEEELKQLESEQQRIGTEARRLKGQQRITIKKRAKVELQVKAAKESVERKTAEIKRATRELDTLQERVAESEAALEAKTTAFERTFADEQKLKQSLALCQQHLAQLYSKQGRSEQFATQAKRDAFLNKELQKVGRDHEAETRALQKLQNDSKTQSKRLAAALKSVAATQQDNKKLSAALDKVLAAHGALKAQRDEAQNARKELWRKESEVEKRMQAYDAAMQQTQRKLQYTMDKSLWKGLQDATRVVKELKIEGVYGPLIELCECDAKFF
jgi:structural maintenance of chromosome 3 (chondroitin sulfate proteoglycan 6)